MEVYRIIFIKSWVTILTNNHKHFFDLSYLATNVYIFWTTWKIKNWKLLTRSVFDFRILQFFSRFVPFSVLFVVYFRNINLKFDLTYRTCLFKKLTCWKCEICTKDVNFMLAMCMLSFWPVSSCLTILQRKFDPSLNYLHSFSDTYTIWGIHFVVNHNSYHRFTPMFHWNNMFPDFESVYFYRFSLFLWITISLTDNGISIIWQNETYNHCLMCYSNIFNVFILFQIWRTRVVIGEFLICSNLI